MMQNRAKNLLAPALLFLIAALVYFPALGGRFLYDDLLSIRDNPLLHARDGLWTIWTTIGRVPGEEHYWPLTYTALWLETQLFGGWTVGFHLVNFALHGLIVVGIWRLMRRVGLKGAWLGAALFAVHPVHVEAVAWIMSIKDLLAAGLYLVAAEWFLNHEERGGWKWLGLAAFAFIAAMLCKSSAVMLPLALAILAWYRRGRIERRAAFGLIVLTAVMLAMIALDMAVVGITTGHVRLPAPPLVERVVQAGLAFGLYLGKLVWPAGLSMIYPQFEVSVANPAQWMPLVALALVTVVLWLARPRVGRGPLACWLFYVVTLGPALGIVYFGFLVKSPAADRYQYLASLAPLAGVGALAGGWIEKDRLKRLAPAAAVLAALSIVTWQQAGYYRDELSLFGRALQVAPQNPVVHLNAGNAVYNLGQYGPAEGFYAEAHRLAPNDGNVIYLLGMTMARQGEDGAAIEFYRGAIAGGCNNPKVWANLAWLLATSPDAKLRNPREALALARQCVDRASKTDAEMLNALAAAQAANGQNREAVETARRGLETAEKENDPGFKRLLEKVIPYYERGEAYVAATK